MRDESRVSALPRVDSRGNASYPPCRLVRPREASGFCRWRPAARLRVESRRFGQVVELGPKDGDRMTQVDWWERWNSGRTGFHLPTPNPALVHFGHRLSGARRVLVPLCGKSRDLTFLAEAGHDVLGVEMVERAARAYFADEGVMPLEERDGDRLRLSHGRVSLWVRDIFDVESSALGACEGVYDRAALIALPLEQRVHYAAQLSEFLPFGAQMLLVTTAYPEGALDGPPFSVSPDEVRALYGARWEIEELSRGPAADPPARFVELGLPLEESVWLLTRGAQISD